MRKLFTLLTILFNSFTVNALTNCQNHKGAKGQWYPAKSTESSGVTLVAHGLNLRPEKMKEIISLLNSKGQHVFNLTLSGHGKESYPLFQKVTPSMWLKDFENSYCEAHLFAQMLNLPLNFLGYSVGASSAILSMQNDLKLFKKMILIAPAIRLKWYTSFIKSLFFIPSSWAIPSKNHKDFRVHNKVPLAAYRSLFEITEKINRTNKERLNIPTLIIYHSKDEVVDSSQLENFRKANSLDQWTFLEITNIEPDIDPWFYHLLISRPAVGENTWKRLSEGILNHLK